MKKKKKPLKIKEKFQWSTSNFDRQSAAIIIPVQSVSNSLLFFFLSFSFRFAVGHRWTNWPSSLIYFSSLFFTGRRNFIWGKWHFLEKTGFLSPQISRKHLCLSYVLRCLRVPSLARFLSSRCLNLHWIDVGAWVHCFRTPIFKKI